MTQLYEYNYIFVIGTLFALLDAFNNGASEFTLLTLLTNLLILHITMCAIIPHREKITNDFAIHR